MKIGNKILANALMKMPAVKGKSPIVSPNADEHKFLKRENSRIKGLI